VEPKKIYTWLELNRELRKTRTMEQAQTIYDAEAGGLRRKRWMKRIWSRYRALRTRAERKAGLLE
jgi:hypothetical protein